MLSWSMDDMLVAATAARAGWTDSWMDKLEYNHTHTHTEKKEKQGSSTFQEGENEARCQPAITATLKLYA